MMKRTVIPLIFPEMKGDEIAEGSFEVQDPGEVVECLIQVKPKVGGIVMAQDTRAPQFDFIPTMLVNIDPEGAIRKRHFIVIPPMRVAETEGQLTYQGRFLFPDGKMLCVFEEIVENKWVHPDDKGGKPITYCRRCSKGVGYWTGPDEGPCRCTQQEMEEFTSSKLVTP